MRGVVEIEVRGIDEWRKTVTELLLPMSIEADDPDEFRARIRAITVNGVRLFRIEAKPYRLTRSHRIVEPSADPFFFVVQQLHGTSTVRQNGNVAVLTPGDFAVYDSLVPLEREFPTVTRGLVMMIPQQLVSLPPTGLAHVTGKRIAADEGLGAVASPLLASLANNLEALETVNGLLTVKAAVDLVTAAVADKIGIDASGGKTTNLELLMAIREYIMANLGDPSLNPDKIATAHSISTRKLHGMFSEQGTTVSTWMRERRLEMARRDLADPLCSGDAIRTICERWGFVDATHFSNAFRLAFGSSPRQYRQEAREIAA